MTGRVFKMRPPGRASGLIGAILLLVAMMGAAVAEPKRGLLLNSFGRDFHLTMILSQNCG